MDSAREEKQAEKDRIYIKHTRAALATDSIATKV